MMKALLFAVLLAPPLQAQTVIDLRFKSDNAHDEAGNHPVTLENVFVAEGDGSFHGDFNGDGAIVVETPGAELAFAAEDTFWAELWVYLSRPTQSATLLSKGSGSNYRIAVGADGIITLSYYAQGSWRNHPASLPIEFHQWQHIGCLFDSPAGRIILTHNGAVSGKAESVIPFQSRDTKPLYIGGSAKRESGFAGMKGLLGGSLIARENLRNIPDDAIVGDKVFSVSPEDFGVSQSAAAPVDAAPRPTGKSSK
jgi:hypothetical protein